MKPFAKYPQIRNLLFANILGIIFFQFFIAKLLKVNSPEGGGGFEDLIYFSLTNMILCLLSINNWLWRVGWALLCFGAGLADYFFSNYGVSIDRDALTVFFQATPKEVGAFDISAILFYLIPSAILILVGWFLVRPSRNELRLRSLSTVFYLTIICSVMGVGVNNWSLVNKYAPYNFLSASYGYYQYTQELEQALRSRKNISEGTRILYQNSDQPLTVVLVIGESARADHFSLNGYNRKTNPLLEKVSNLVNFTHATSCGTYTHISVPCLLTRATRSNLSPIENETSVISVFNALDFDTSWLGSQGDLSLSQPISYICNEARKKVILYAADGGPSPYDGHLLPYLDEAIKSANSQFVVLHTNGSHIQYLTSYPKEFNVFPAECKEGKADLAQRISSITNAKVLASSPYVYTTKKMLDDCGSSLETLIKSYDNSIVYTDWVLNEIIKRLEKKNAIMVYVSDHGESLGENGKFLHGHIDERSNWEVPMIAWASDSFISKNPKKWAKFKSNKQKKVSHDNVFHTLLDCSGVDSSLIDKSLSLCH